MATYYMRADGTAANKAAAVFDAAFMAAMEPTDPRIPNPVEFVPGGLTPVT